MKFDNKIKIILDANSKNEAIARVSVASFASQLNPTLQDIEDIKMAVSEAVTNSIIHGYEGNGGEIFILCGILEDTIHIEIKDNGIGINNIEKAMEPLYTSKPNMERSGMGFTVMEAFMDDIKVTSTTSNFVSDASDISEHHSNGTKITMSKKIQNIKNIKNTN